MNSMTKPRLDIWKTAAQWAGLGLPEIPASESAMIRRAKRESWPHRDREGPGGGREYPLSALPDAARAAYRRVVAEEIMSVPLPRPVLAGAPKADPDHGVRDNLRRDAKLTILTLFAVFRMASGRTVRDAEHEFSRLYNLRALDAVPEWVYRAKTSVSPASLHRWRRAREEGRANDLGGDYGTRRGVLETAQGGEVATWIAALIVRQPHLSGDHLRDLTRDKFGKTLDVDGKRVALPGIRAFQRFAAAWKAEHEEALVKMTDPDRWKSNYRFAGTDMYAWVTKLNMLWEIDASPADVLLTDGRYTMYGLVDIYSRRKIVLISRTAKTDATLLLIRKAILAWGVPEIVRTDNGSDFTSHAFVTAIYSLGIVHDITQPFSPEQKGSIESSIKTVQHGFMPLLPGYIGHSVADRKQIEARKAFAQRLGESDENAFCVELTHQELQKFADDWLEHKHHHKAHSGLDGKTPFGKAAEYTGPVKRIENIRALDLLLAPIADNNGIRTVTKRGIQADTAYFMAAALPVGKRVFCRFDPDDMGRIYVYSEDRREFIAEAICAKRLGIDPGEAARAVRDEQKRLLATEVEPFRRQIKAMKPRDMIEAVLRVAREDSASLTQFPRPSIPHTTPEIAAAEAAASVVDRRAPTVPEPTEDERKYMDAVARDLAKRSQEPVVHLPESPKQRFRRALAVQARIDAGEAVSIEEAQWLGGYKTGSDWRAYSGMLEDFGPTWLEA